MEEKIIKLLRSNDLAQGIPALSELCDIEAFQATNLIEEFQLIEQVEADMVGIDNSHLENQKRAIVQGLANGTYASEENKENALRQEIIKIMQIPKMEEGIAKLSELLGIEAIEAAKYIEDYQNKEKLEMTRQGLNTESIINYKWQIISEMMEKSNLRTSGKSQQVK